jgi:hypothetical protein
MPQKRSRALGRLVGMGSTPLRFPSYGNGQPEPISER